MNPAQRNQLTEAITGTFMWSFKKGDNIIYNLEIAWELYEAKARSVDKRKFTNRIRGHVNDTVPNISQSDIVMFRTKKYDKLEQYIAASKKLDLFNQPASFYDSMDVLRKARNRIHVQNSKNQLAADEFNVFTDALLAKAQQAVEVVLATMIVVFPRNGRTIAPNSVPLPWRISAS